MGLGLGGMETTVMNYYRHIDRSKIQYDFCFTERVYNENHYYEKEAICLGAYIYRSPLRRKSIIKDSIAFVKELKKHRDINIIQIYSTRASLSYVLVLLLAKMAGIKVRIAYSANDIRAYCGFTHKVCRILVRILATKMVAGSTEAGLSMFGKRAKDKVSLIPRARNLEDFRYSPEKRRLKREELKLNNQFVIMHVGRMVKEKNHAFILELFAQALKKNQDMILLLAGDGELRSDLIDKATALSLGDKVRFLGQRDDVPELLQASDLFVLPSLHEGLPGVAIEAQTAGLPCLLADTISKESRVTELVEFLPIDKDVHIWTERILAYRNFERRDTSEDVRKAGYDIKEAAKWLEGFYFNQMR